VLEKERKRRRSGGETNVTSEDDSEPEGHQRKKSRRDKVLEYFIWLARS
jgi:hypothetical protein